MAEFATPDDLVRAAERAHEEGYRNMDAFTPMPVHGLAEALGVRSTKLPLVVLIGAIVGALGGYGLQVYITMLSYVHNVGGRPPHSWPAYIPVTFETTVLCASLSAVIGMFAMNGLPRPYHPVFNVSRFDRASHDGFFLCIEATDPVFDRDGTREFLASLDAYEVTDVEE
jgi:hypothetical protein